MVKTTNQLFFSFIRTIFIGDMLTIPSHGWFMTLFSPHGLPDYHETL